MTDQWGNPNSPHPQRPSRTRKVVGLIITTILVFAWVYWIEERQASGAMMCQPASSEVACATPTQLARKFRNDKLGHSTGLMIPKRIRLMARAEAQRQGVTLNLRLLRDSWGSPMTANQCAVGVPDGTYPDCVNPAEQRNGFGIPWKQTDDVAIACGGAGLIGFIGGRASGAGWWGLGIGVAGCLWSSWMGHNR